MRACSCSRSFPHQLALDGYGRPTAAHRGRQTYECMRQWTVIMMVSCVAWVLWASPCRATLRNCIDHRVSETHQEDVWIWITKLISQARVVLSAILMCLEVEVGPALFEQLVEKGAPTSDMWPIPGELTPSMAARLCAWRRILPISSFINMCTIVHLTLLHGFALDPTFIIHTVIFTRMMFCHGVSTTLYHASHGIIVVLHQSIVQVLPIASVSTNTWPV